MTALVIGTLYVLVAVGFRMAIVQGEASRTKRIVSNWLAMLWFPILAGVTLLFGLIAIWFVIQLTIWIFERIKVSAAIRFVISVAIWIFEQVRDSTSVPVKPAEPVADDGS